MPELSNKQFLILDIITNYKKPVGSGTLSMELAHKNKSLSEATAGRVLRSLDRKGYTEKVGFQGRLVTSKGLRILKQHRLQRMKKKQLTRLLEFSRVSGKKDLIDILIARRAIEREIAGLAAENVNEQDIQEISKNINKHESKCKENMSGVEEDKEFHTLLASIAQNKVLQTSLRFIINEEEVSPILEFIRKEVGSTLIADHKEILAALESGSSRQAEDAMLKHINNLISDVNKYWSRIDENNFIKKEKEVSK